MLSGPKDWFEVGVDHQLHCSEHVRLLLLAVNQSHISPRTPDHALHSDKTQTEVTGRVVHFHKGRSNRFSPYVQLGDRIAIEALMCGFVPGLNVVPCSGEVPGSPALLCGE